MHGVIRVNFNKRLDRSQERFLYPWCARLTGLSSQYGFRREFVRGAIDYTHAWTRHAHGAQIYFAVAPGLYEVNVIQSKNNTWRYYARVDDDGNVTRITREEVIECLQNADSASAS